MTTLFLCAKSCSGILTSEATFPGVIFSTLGPYEMTTTIHGLCLLCHNMRICTKILKWYVRVGPKFSNLPNAFESNAVETHPGFHAVFCLGWAHPKTGAGGGGGACLPCLPATLSWRYGYSGSVTELCGEPRVCLLTHTTSLSVRTPLPHYVTVLRCLIPVMLPHNAVGACRGGDGDAAVSCRLQCILMQGLRSSAWRSPVWLPLPNCACSSVT